jgi:soluble lytic murein transglycosylase
VACLAPISILLACHGEPPPALYTSAGTEEPQAQEQTAPESPPDDRGLWFNDGAGRRAMMARERRDHEAAIRELDALLADPQLGADDRGVAQLLRGLEAAEQEHYEEAADRVAKAREAPALRSIDVWLRAKEAQLRLDASQPGPALALVRDVKPTPGLGDTMLAIEASALKRTDADDQARARYEAYLSEFPRGAHAYQVRVELGDLLAKAQRVDEAAKHYERVILDRPLSNWARDAGEALATLEKSGKLKRSQKHLAEFERKRKLATMRSRLSRRGYDQVIREADGFSNLKGLSAKEKCQASYLRASAVFKKRERAKARAWFDKATSQCQAAGATDEVVKSRYQSARGRYAQGQHTKAAQAFEKLALDHASHSYSDDAWIKAGEAWEEAGQLERARKAYGRALEKPYRGDMENEARRRLLVQAFSQKRYEDALKIIDVSLGGGIGHRRERAKMHYFRGRALEELGKKDAAKQAWLSAVGEMPLSYPAVQSLSRLRDQSEEAAAEGLAILEREAGSATNLGLPETPAIARARLFARLGLGDMTQLELEHAKVDGWPAASLLSQAGLYDEAQRKLANLGLDWRQAPPTGAPKKMWEIAHPMPFTEIIEPGEKEHGVPDLLTFAIMQTESRFDPNATSWAGARGLVQLMPATAKSVAQKAGVDLSGNDQLYDPATNLGLGMRYLARLTQRWGGGDAGPALAIPSYNAGAGSVDKWVAERGEWPLDLFIESIPYDETRRYTQKVLERWAIYRWMYGEGTPQQKLVYLPTVVPKRAG